MEIGSRPFIVCEMSGNHKGSLLTALDLIVAAKRCGADAVKIQLYEPDDLNDPANNKIYQECKIPLGWLPHLFNAAKAVGIHLFSSVFAEWAIEHLKKFECPAIKLASPESTRLPDQRYHDLKCLTRMAGMQLIVSSGRRDMNFINDLWADVTMYCVAGYPAVVTDDDAAYLSRMKPHYERGFSDHSNDIKTPLAMIAAGARIIEKHFKLDDNCIDAAFSLNPQQMKLLCDIAHR